MKIYKYTLRLTGSQIVKIPGPRKFLSFLLQNDQLQVWYEVGNITQAAGIQFIIVGTGERVPENANYLGTVQQEPFVWHLYERIAS